MRQLVAGLHRSSALPAPVDMQRQEELPFPGKLLLSALGERRRRDGGGLDRRETPRSDSSRIPEPWTHDLQQR